MIADDWLSASNDTEMIGCKSCDISAEVGLNEYTERAPSWYHLPSAFYLRPQCVGFDTLIHLGCVCVFLRLCMTVHVFFLFAVFGVCGGIGE